MQIPDEADSFLFFFRTLDCGIAYKKNCSKIAVPKEMLRHHALRQPRQIC